jgi:hypothetical protein
MQRRELDIIYEVENESLPSVWNRDALAVFAIVVLERQASSSQQSLRSFKKRAEGMTPFVTHAPVRRQSKTTEEGTIT